MKSKLLPGHGEHAKRFRHRNTKEIRNLRKQKWRKWIWFLLPLLIMVGFARRCKGSNDLAETFRIPPPGGIRTGKRIDLFFSFDDSSSTDESDPNNLRYRAANFAVRYLRCQQLLDLTDRVGVNHFSDAVAGSMDLLNLGELVIDDKNTVCEKGRNFTDGHDEVTPAFAQAFRRATDGGTAFVPPLKDAASKLRGDAENVKRLLIFFTDGVSDETPSQIRSALSALNGVDVRLFVLDASGIDKRILNNWNDAGISQPFRLSKLRGNRLECEFAKVIVNTLEMEWLGEC